MEDKAAGKTAKMLPQKGLIVLDKYRMRVTMNPTKIARPIF